MEGILGVIGFWLFMILFVLKKPLTEYLDRQKTVPNKDVEQLSERVLQLESVIGTLTKDMLEMKDTTEFAQKLLTDSSKQVSTLSQRLTKEGVLESGGSSGGIKTLTKRDEVAANQIKLVTTDDALLADMGTILNEHAVRFERVLPASPDKVWEHLTNPELLKSWLAAGSIEPRIGGRVELKFDVEERETDDLQRRVDMLKRDSTQEAGQAAGQLDSRLQDEYRDLRDLELQIRDLDMAMR